ncbi:amidase family protein [Loktanella sp. SALINAS62]|uniref:amidase n=1 Tax=Loktanella sp. SALINAS62 TaxID=2706124 RepID=UPI001B8BEB5A|nr:amidase family protein [Loktanella sp. SALINAS62]MBS1302377.1 amidase [Loktanella sp. SALINAS62]
MDDWRWMTAQDLGMAIAAGGIDPAALCEVFLAAIAAHPDGKRIYTSVTENRARAEAHAASDRASSGLRRGPLDGVPISWKDLFDTAGTTTEAGTRLLSGRVPVRDALVLENATAAGLVCLGKTHMSEIAFSGLGVNPITATPPNRNDHDAAPGGSSSGAAASVAFGLAAAAIGSDTGGSVRVPAAWNDLTGFKTTHGRLTLQGTVPLCITFDSIGPLCRSVTDAALLTAALGGERAPDLSNPRQDLHMAILDTVAMDGLEQAPADGFRAAVATLQSAGVTVDHLKFPPMEEVFTFAGPLYTADAWAWWRDLISTHPGVMFNQIEERVSAGQDVSAADYIASWTRLRAVRAEFAEAIAPYDAILMPTASILPPKVRRLLDDSDYYKTQNLLTLRNTRIANLMDLPAVTLPTGTPSCGIMLCGQPGRDDALLRVARAAEMALA